MDFNSAKKKFEEGLYETAFKEFYMLALELRLLNKSEEKISDCMQMALACYEALEKTSLPKEMSLLDQFYFAVRQYMDNKCEVDAAQVAKEIYREIPLGIPDERMTIFSTGNRTFEAKKAGRYHTATVTAQGPRDEMEDQHLVTEITLSSHLSGIPFFGVFDGHGGLACSYFVKQKLPSMLEKALESCQMQSDLEMYNSLRKVFVQLDREWMQLPFQRSSSPDFSGSTASICLILNHCLWVTNVGDSRTILVNGKKVIQLSEEAKPTISKYKKEIYFRGGEVERGRVKGRFGTLDMARSIGDIDQPSVSALPTVKKFDLTNLGGGQNYLVLACDGLWDVVSPRMAADVCFQSKSIEESARKLERIAFLRGTTDNVTIIVVDLGNP